MAGCGGCSDISAGFADGNHQFNFVLKIRGHRRIGHCTAVRHDRIRRLHEEKWLLTFRIEAHLAHVRRIIAADTVNSMDRKARSVEHGDSGWLRRLKSKSYLASLWRHHPRCSRHSPSASCTGRSEKLNSVASVVKARCEYGVQ